MGTKPRERDRNPKGQQGVRCAHSTEEGWETRNVTRDLHAGGPSGVMTDYEAKFYDRGVKICRLEAVRLETTKSTAAGPVPRLRNASLTDARGYAESAEAASEGSEK